MPNEDTHKSFWVSYTDELTPEGGVELDAAPVKWFLRNLAGLLIQSGRSGTGVFLDKEGTFVISAVFDAADDLGAFAQARELFSDAIDQLGGRADIPPGPHPAWFSHAFVDRARKLVVPLALAA